MTWARLEDPRNQRRFWHFNTHWCVHSNASHICDEDTRYRGAKTMVKAVGMKILPGDPLANVYSLRTWKWPIEIVDLPFKNGGSFQLVKSK